MTGLSMGKSIALLLALLLGTNGFIFPRTAEAASCNDICSLNANNAKDMIRNAECKANKGCMDCVVQSLVGSQSGAYCSGYEKSKKGEGIETVTTVLNTTAAVACGVACAWASNEALGKVCAIGGLGIMAYEVGATVVGLTKGENDIMNIVGQSLALKGKLSSSINTLNNIKAIKSGSEAAKKGLKNPACANAALFTLTASMKFISKNKMKKASQQSCQTVEQLATTLDGPVQACLAKASINTIGGTTLSGLIKTNTTITLPTPQIKDVSQYASTSKGTDPYLREMQNELQSAVDSGKINIADIASKLDSGVSPASILSGIEGLPSEVADAAKEMEKQMERGEKSEFLASVVGGGYSASGAGNTRNVASISDPFSEMSFGNEATPGEGHETLEIEKNAQTHSKPGFHAGDDIFHSGFPGTIFEIVTGRIQEQKDQYAELEPEGRMNRVFNGYSDPKSRSPASKPGAKKRK
jgi:hypothetical protein